MARFKVTKVVREESRVLIYGHPKWDDYHVIAHKNIDVKELDEIEYAPDGLNFGWLIRVISKT